MNDENLINDQEYDTLFHHRHLRHLCRMAGLFILNVKLGVRYPVTTVLAMMTSTFMWFEKEVNSFRSICAASVGSA